MTVEVENLVTNLDAHDAELGNWNSPESIGRRQPNENVPPAKEDDKFYGSEVWRTKTFKSLKKHFSRDQTIRKPHYFGAPVITGNTLLKDTQVALIWQQTARHAAGVEMELGGVCRAARYGRGPVTHVLGIRGLSDIIGYARAPEWTEYACHSAAALAYELIRSGLIRSP
jgi:nucleoside phosphorylase